MSISQPIAVNEKSEHAVKRGVVKLTEWRYLSQC